MNIIPISQTCLNHDIKHRGKHSGTLDKRKFQLTMLKFWSFTVLEFSSDFGNT